MFLIFSCNRQETERIKSLRDIKINLTVKNLPYNDKYYARVIEFRNISDNDTSRVRVFATIYKDSSCAIDIQPFENFPKQRIENLGDVPEQQNGHTLSYDEQMAMLMRVVAICKSNYCVNNFIHLRAYLESMGDFNVYVSERYDSLLQYDTDKYEAFYMTLNSSYLTEDLKLIFNDYKIVCDSEPSFLYPRQIDYSQFASNNKLKKAYTLDYVYSGIFAEYRIIKE